MPIPEKMKDLTCCPDCCPMVGDVYVCEDCHMTLQAVKGCPNNADPECCTLACCGKPMTKVN